MKKLIAVVILFLLLNAVCVQFEAGASAPRSRECERWAAQLGYDDMLLNSVGCSQGANGRWYRVQGVCESRARYAYRKGIADAGTVELFQYVGCTIWEDYSYAGPE